MSGEVCRLVQLMIKKQVLSECEESPDSQDSLRSIHGCMSLYYVIPVRIIINAKHCCAG